MKLPELPRRSLGRTGQMSTIVGLGGITLMQSADEAEAARMVEMALDAGVNHLDVAPSYGQAQQRMGAALGKRRREVFISCKTLERDAAGARRELEESLRLLRTDHIDLYQFHALDTPDDLERVCAPGGALEAFVEARQKGLIGHIGVTGHRLRMHVETIRRIAEIETVMFPLNFRTAGAALGSGGLAEEARRRGLGLIAIKATTRGEIGPTADAYRWTLSQDVDLTLPAGGEFPQALEVARNFTAMSPAEQAGFIDHCRMTYEPGKLY